MESESLTIKTEDPKISSLKTLFENQCNEKLLRLKTEKRMNQYLNQIQKMFCISRSKKLEKSFDTIYKRRETFKCEICDKVYARNHYLLAHKYIYHALCDTVEQFECTECGAIFHNLEAFQAHHERYKINTEYCLLKRKEIQDKHLKTGIYLANYGRSVNALRRIEFPLLSQHKICIDETKQEDILNQQNEKEIST